MAKKIPMSIHLREFITANTLAPAKTSDREMEMPGEKGMCGCKKVPISFDEPFSLMMMRRSTEFRGRRILE